jgi:NhaP-type Na+/H+ or K+/H+ antiporter
MSLDPHILFLFGLGVVVLLVAWLPLVIKQLPLSLAIICVGLGFLAFSSGFLEVAPSPTRFSTYTEYVTEVVVIVSLMGAGLKLDRPLSLARWGSSIRLIGIAMPLSIIGVTLLGIYGLGLSLGTALLLGAVLAPTDPVLASDVQVGKPHSGEEGEVRFALTSEAGLNDGFAFPFVHLAIAVAAAGALTQEVVTHAILVDGLWRIGAGVVVGLVLGRVLGWMTFKAPHANFSKTGDGLVALGATFAAYGVAEMMHGYGFLAVFVTAVTLRATERGHEFNDAMHDFSEQIERLLILLLLVLFGGAIADGLFDSLTWAEIGFGLALLFVIRPLSAWIGFIGSPVRNRDRAIISFLGIRGMGSFYYLAYALNHGQYEGWGRLWAITGFVVLCSIFLHGVTATPLMRWIDRRPPPKEPDDAQGAEVRR